MPATTQYPAAFVSSTTTCSIPCRIRKEEGITRQEVKSSISVNSTLRTHHPSSLFHDIAPTISGQFTFCKCEIRLFRIARLHSGDLPVAGDSGSIESPVEARCLNPQSMERFEHDSEAFARRFSWQFSLSARCERRRWHAEVVRLGELDLAKMSSGWGKPLADQERHGQDPLHRRADIRARRRDTCRFHAVRGPGRQSGAISGQRRRG